ncbi:ABC transporter [candidate division KSB3 bacterium]|uniref:ABC transporter n=1 Tax=candidate division KSB3 bacterium TaxID=2044937 RepID=A0A2G6KI76_9BACT|nr:MAG: ABC transporter [candidate division KSB3 bacterium]
MGFLEMIYAALSDYTLRTVILGTAILGMVSGALGCFAFLRRQSLLGDAISHAALPGIALAFLLTGSKTTLVLVLGAALSGWIGMVCVMSIVRYTRVKEDSALGIILSVFFGFGMVLLAVINRLPTARKAGLQKFLFGMAATMLEEDVIAMAVLGLIVLGLMLLLWKEFKLLSFNPEFGATLGFPIRAMDVLLTALIVTAIVIGLEAVGVVLMSAMIVAPAAAARQWTDRLHIMVLLASMFGALSGICGAVLSGMIRHLPTGPTVVLCMSGIVLFSLVFAPKHGIFFRWMSRRRVRQDVRFRRVLTDLYRLVEHHQGERQHGHPVTVLMLMDSWQSGVKRSLKLMQTLGFVEQASDKGWILTERGLEEAQNMVGRHGDAYES